MHRLTALTQEEIRELAIRLHDSPDNPPDWRGEAEDAVDEFGAENIIYLILRHSPESYPKMNTIIRELKDVRPVETKEEKEQNDVPE